MIGAASLRRVITWSAIVGYGLIVSGLPLPLGVESPASSSAAKRLAGKDHSTPFPCMDKPCGCATAEQCFTSCCCHSPAETLAWARAHKVEPAVIAALQRRVAAAPMRAKPSRSAVSSCCEANSRCAVKPSCCEAAVSCCEAAVSCCEAAVQPAGDDPAKSSDEPDSGKSLSLRAMLACGGIVAEWFSCGVSLPPPHVALVNEHDFIEMIPCLHESALPLRAAPDVPPPRVG